MAGTRGPVPKRSTERRRRNKPESGAVTQAPAGSPTSQPDPDEAWHPIAKRYWAALGVSGQAVFYQASDWAVAYDLMDDLTAYKTAEKRSAVMRASIDATLARLMATEGDRRRLRVELERTAEVDPDEAAAVTALDAYRARLNA